METIEPILVQRVFIDPYDLDQLITPRHPQQLESGVVQERKPMFVDLVCAPQKPAARVGLCRQFDSTSNNFTGEAELAQGLGYHRAKFGLRIF